MKRGKTRVGSWIACAPTLLCVGQKPQWQNIEIEKESRVKNTLELMGVILFFFTLIIISIAIILLDYLGQIVQILTRGKLKMWDVRNWISEDMREWL